MVYTSFRLTFSVGRWKDLASCLSSLVLYFESQPDATYWPRKKASGKLTRGHCNLTAGKLCSNVTFPSMLRTLF